MISNALHFKLCDHSIKFFCEELRSIEKSFVTQHTRKNSSKTKVKIVHGTNSRYEISTLHSSRNQTKTKSRPEKQNTHIRIMVSSWGRSNCWNHLKLFQCQGKNDGEPMQIGVSELPSSNWVNCRSLTCKESEDRRAFGGGIAKVISYLPNFLPAILLSKLGTYYIYPCLTTMWRLTTLNNVFSVTNSSCLAQY